MTWKAKLTKQEQLHKKTHDKFGDQVRYPPIGGYIDERDPGSLLTPQEQRELRDAFNGLWDAGDDAQEPPEPPQ